MDPRALLRHQSTKGHLEWASRQFDTFKAEFENPPELQLPSGDEEREIRLSDPGLLTASGSSATPSPPSSSTGVDPSAPAWPDSPPRSELPSMSQRVAQRCVLIGADKPLLAFPSKIQDDPNLHREDGAITALSIPAASWHFSASEVTSPFQVDVSNQSSCPLQVAYGSYSAPNMEPCCDGGGGCTAPYDSPTGNGSDTLPYTEELPAFGSCIAPFVGPACFASLEPPHLF